jgi:phage FluMu protein Com
MSKPSDRRAGLNKEETFTFRCPACAKLLILDQTLAGSEGPCPKCDTLIVSADPAKEKQARRTRLEAPEKRIAFSPQIDNRAVRHRQVPTEMPLKAKPLALGRVAKMSELPPDKRSPNAARLGKTDQKNLTLWQRLHEPKTLSWLRTMASLLAIVAIVAGILLLRSRGQ